MSHAEKTHCPQGHPYDETNTYHFTLGKWTARGCRTCRREATRRWRAENKVKRAAYAREHRRRPGERTKNDARARLRTAVARGKIEKPDSCEACGAGGQLEGHHADYSRPLDVVWLCCPCHRSLHVEAAVA